MNNLKRILAIVLALVMVFGTMASVAFAVEGEGEGDNSSETRAATGVISIIPPDGETLKGRTFELYHIFEAHIQSVTDDENQIVKNIVYGWNGINVDVGGEQRNQYYKFFSDSTIFVNTEDYNVDNDATNISKVVGAIEDQYEDKPDVFADKLYDYIKKEGITATKTATAVGEKLDITGLPHGYYVVIETTALADGQVRSAVMLTTADPSVEITLKLGSPAFQKLVSRNGGAEADRTSATVGTIGVVSGTTATVNGDRLTYKIKAQIPDFSRYVNHTGNVATVNGEEVDNDLKVIITDEWESTVTPLWNTVSATIDTTPLFTGYTNISSVCEVTLDENARKMTFDFNHDVIKGWAPGKTLTITYDAILNTSANVNDNETGSIKITSHNNKATFEYSNDPYTVETTAKLTADTEVNTYGLDVTKVNGIGNKLAGAEFKLGYKLGGTIIWAEITDGKIVGWRAAEEYATVLTSAETTGLISATGLGTGTYVLLETNAPEGYKKGADAFEFTIIEDATNGLTVTGACSNQYMTFPGGVKGDGIVDAEVVNLPAGELPETGGMGTTMFIFGGIALMAGAAAFLVLRKREAKN